MAAEGVSGVRTGLAVLQYIAGRDTHARVTENRCFTRNTGSRTQVDLGETATAPAIITARGAIRREYAL
jgi:hypothetical protein